MTDLFQLELDLLDVRIEFLKARAHILRDQISSLDKSIFEFTDDLSLDLITKRNTYAQYLDSLDKEIDSIDNERRQILAARTLVNSGWWKLD